MQLTAALLCIFASLVGAALTPVFAKIHPKVRDVWAVLAALTAAGAAVRLLPGIFHPESFPVEYAYTRLSNPIHISFGILLDPVSIEVVNAVAVVSAIIMLYVVGYMMGDPGRTRFWMWMNALITVGQTAFYTTRFFGLVFHGKESQNVAHAKAHGAYLNDGHLTQIIACGIAAVMILGAGIFGKTLEHTPAKGFEYSLITTLHLPVAEAVTHAPHWLIPVLSVVFLLLGVIPGYILFIKRDVSVHDLVENNGLLKAVHTFLWKRWYIDGAQWMRSRRSIYRCARWWGPCRMISNPSAPR